MNSMFNLKNKTGHPTVAVQPKLRVNVPGDRYEQEADAMAERVMGLSTSRDAAGGRMGSHVAGPAPVSNGGMIGRSVQRKCAHCEEEEQKKKTVMRKSEGGVAGVSGGADSGGLGSALSRSSGSGLPLPQATRGFMEGAFSADFSGVRVHADDRASEMSRSVRAKAFTYGNDIYFRQGAYDPGSRAGQSLLAHELTHVLQQDGAAQEIRRQEDADEPRCYACTIPGGTGVCCPKRPLPYVAECSALGKSIVDHCPPGEDCSKEARCAQCQCVGDKLGEEYCSCTGII